MSRLFFVLLVLSVSCSDKNQNNSEPSSIEIPARAANDSNKSATQSRPAAGDQISDQEHTGDIGAQNFAIDASSTTAYVYLKLDDSKVVPTTQDQSWFLAVKRTQFQTNSGSSGTLQFGAHNTEKTEFADVTNCEAADWTHDAILPASGAPGSQPSSGNALLNSWYNYDPATHVVSSKALVYLISDGTHCLKLQISSYESGVYKVVAAFLPAAPLPQTPAPTEIPVPTPTETPIPTPIETPAPTPTETPTPVDLSQTVDAASSSAAVFVKFDQGQLITSSADALWHFSVKRTTFQTNSGTSGAGNFGVALAASSDYAQVTSCATTSLAYDEILPASGAPGSQPYSGNALLNAWYNYDPATHVVSSKQLVYLISNGNSCFKMQIVSYAGGVYRILVDSLAIPSFR